MADALRALREAKGWSQEKLAIEADMHRTMIGAYERAERKIYLSAAKQILRALGFTWSDLGRELDKHDAIKSLRRGRRR
jgi:transcriptional regulator with XRE-family HTH domain